MIKPEIIALPKTGSFCVALTRGHFCLTSVVHCVTKCCPSNIAWELIRVSDKKYKEESSPPRKTGAILFNGLF